MMSILGTLFIGLIAGFIARALKPGNDSMGWIMTALLGVAGAFLAGYLGAALGFYTQGDPVGFIASVIGAIILLVIYGFFKKR
ncbi:MAG: GlsB/YeaQ/YmgE family stress response membrane protein [Hydrogenophaga sp.]|uniref:GlsB/YeaQ/YmgE family stress response membrane protein n=1 Tax=Hydrogenophaga sp. TaxID=1904254 RepID=UPI002ABB5289|nr:GlsB/YeaQ/YmgE family stress response membrane protein [Hydrogenophaga sp.]MDZ4103075.1 GlsB/YeaQ/YmgE family stress response membrane protein [Hydrogenophaga sp.]